MKFILKNSELSQTMSLMLSFELSREDNRHRNKFVNEVKKAYEDYFKEENDLKEQFGLLDEDGVVIPIEKANTKKVIAYNKEAIKLGDEEVVIQGGMYEKNFDEIPRIIEEFDGKLSGGNGVIYDKLIDQIEEEQEGK